MKLWVKICANTTLEDARLAADLGADAVGFVFAPSKRQVTAEQVAAIVPHLPAKLEKIGVFVDETAEAIAKAVQTAGLTGVQLHFPAPAELATELRQKLGQAIRIVRVVHFALGGPVPVLSAGDLGEEVNAILVDTKTGTETGGTGKAFDWGQAAKLFHDAAKPMIAAGGLTPENFVEATRILRPWGVDVASGVEAVPGRKDPAKLRAFIAKARAGQVT